MFHGRKRVKFQNTVNYELFWWNYPFKAKHSTQNVAYTMSNQIYSQFNTLFLGFVGDTIASVNDTSVEGFRHKEIVQLIKSSGSIRYVDT